MKYFLFLLVLVAGCIDLSQPKSGLITVTGTVTDTATGAPLGGAGVQVVFGSCVVTCVFQGSPGTGPTDSAGHYTVQITGPEEQCSGYAYFVHVDAGSGYVVGDKAFGCGVTSATVDFSLRAVKAYTISGFVTHAENGNQIVGAVVLVGLYPTGTSCLPTTSCNGTELTSVQTSATGGYILSFHGDFSPVACAGKDYLVTVRAGPGYQGGEGHVACGQTTSTLNLALSPP